MYNKFISSTTVQSAIYNKSKNITTTQSVHHAKGLFWENWEFEKDARTYLKKQGNLVNLWMVAMMETWKLFWFTSVMTKETFFSETARKGWNNLCFFFPNVTSEQAINAPVKNDF